MKKTTLFLATLLFCSTIKPEGLDKKFIHKSIQSMIPITAGASGLYILFTTPAIIKALPKKAIAILLTSVFGGQYLSEFIKKRIKKDKSRNEHLDKQLNEYIQYLEDQGITRVVNLENSVVVDKNSNNCDILLEYGTNEPEIKAINETELNKVINENNQKEKELGIVRCYNKETRLPQYYIDEKNSLIDGEALKDVSQNYIPQTIETFKNFPKNSTEVLTTIFQNFKIIKKKIIK